jgi:hypothetical protein
VAGHGTVAGGNRRDEPFVAQSRAAAAGKTRSRAQQLAIAILALLLIALLGFYTLVTGRISDGSARLRTGQARPQPARLG